MPSTRLHGSLSGNPRSQAGVTFVELLVVLVILSTLAVLALPYAEITITRNRELELKRSLREVRTAIDRFHEDWRAGRMPQSSEVVSEDGYPVSLDVLVEGVDMAAASGKRRKYLRRIPGNPFADASAPYTEQWLLIGYQDDPETPSWGGADVYDIRANVDRSGLDGSNYRGW